MTESSREKREEDAVSASTPRPHSPSSHDASLPGDKETLELDELRTDAVEPTGRTPGPGEDVERRNELNRMKSTATSVTSAAATTRLPEQKPWYKQPNPLRWGKIAPVPYEKEVCPEYHAGFFNSLVFQWIAPLMSTGYKRPLEFNDIYSVNPARAVDPLTDKMRDSFKRRVEKGDKFPLLWAMHETFFREFWLGGFCGLMASILQVMSPFTLRYLIQFATDAYVASVRGGPAPDIGKGIGLVLGVTAMQILQSLAMNHFIYRGMLVGGMARGSLISLIYEKSMVISGRAKAGGAELPDSPAARAAQKQREKDAKKGPKGQPGVSGDGEGWGNGRIVSKMSGCCSLAMLIDLFRPIS